MPVPCSTSAPGAGDGPLSWSGRVLSRCDTVHSTVHCLTRSATPQIPRCASHSRFRGPAGWPPGDVVHDQAVARRGVFGPDIGDVAVVHAFLGVRTTLQEHVIRRRGERKRGEQRGDPFPGMADGTTEAPRRSAIGGEV